MRRFTSLNSVRHFAPVPSTGVRHDLAGRVAERTANLIGTGRFLAVQTAVIVVWLAANLAPRPLRFDPYPFDFLTLVLSLQAAYAAPLILLAQRRQDDRDRVWTQTELQVQLDLQTEELLAAVTVLLVDAGLAVPSPQ